MKKLIALILSLACLSSLTFAMETPVEGVNEEPTVTTLADAVPELRAKALEDWAAISSRANDGIQPASTTSALDEENILIVDYGMTEEDGYQVETILYVDKTRASSGEVGGGSTHRYYRAGQNVFNVYLSSYFSYDGTEVGPNYNQQDCWCSNESVTFYAVREYNNYNNGNYSQYANTDWVVAYRYGVSTTGISEGRDITIACSPTGSVKTEDSSFRY